MKEKINVKIIKYLVILALVSVSFMSGYSASKCIDYPVYASGNSNVVSSTSTIATEFREKESIIDEESKWIAKLLGGIDENNDDDKRTYATCAILRKISNKYDNSIEEVVNQNGQWILYNENNVVTSHNYALAREVVEMMHIGILPASDSFLYVEWSKDRVILKNDYDNPTLGWRWGEGVFKYGSK